MSRRDPISARHRRPARKLIGLVVVVSLAAACAGADAPASGPPAVTTETAGVADGGDTTADATAPVTSAVGGDGGDGGDGASTEPPPSTSAPLPPFDAALVPPMPPLPAATLSAGADPAALAMASAAAVGADSADPVAGWLTVYTELGIPVILPGATAVDDPVGPAWDQVWSVGNLSTGQVSLPSTEAERLIEAMIATEDAVGPVTVPPGTLLGGIRSMAASSEPQAVFAARFLAQRSIDRGLPDPLDPATTSEQFVVDPAGLALVMWLSLRSALASIEPGLGADGVEAPQGTVAGFASLRAAPSGPSLCSSPSDSEAWVLFLTKVVGSGVDIGEFGIPGIADVIAGAVALNAVDADAARAIRGRVKVVLGIASLATSIVSAIAAYAAAGVSLSMSPSPLERNRESREGKTATVNITLSFQKGTSGQAAEAACALNVLSRVVGAELSLPQEGTKISGADVIPEAGKNVPEKVLFDVGSRVLTTNDAGVAVLPLRGAARPKDLPESARQYDDTFSIRISAQFESVSAQGILDTFLGGIGLNPVGALGAAVNVLKTIRYDMGEHTLPLKDWRLEGYRIDQPYGALTLSGAVCGLSNLFQITIGGGLSGQLQFSPSSDTAGTFTGQSPETLLFWTGTYTVDSSDPDRVILTPVETSGYSDLPPPVGRVDITGNFWDGEPIFLIPDPSACGL